MSKDQQQSPEERAAIVLKEVNQKIKDIPTPTDSTDSQTSAEEVAQQQKGSDADVDQSVGFDHQSDVKEAAEQARGSDADLD